MEPVEEGPISPETAEIRTLPRKSPNLSGELPDDADPEETIREVFHAARGQTYLSVHTSSEACRVRAGGATARGRVVHGDAVGNGAVEDDMV